MQEQTDIETLTGHRVQLSKREHRIEQVLRIYSERKRNLADLTTPRHLNRSMATLKAYCRRFKIAFPDYTPRAMKPKKAA